MRWTIRRKAQIIAAVANGNLALDELREHYGITPDEFAEWQRNFDRHGVDGLRSTRLHYYEPQRLRPTSRGGTGKG